MKVLLSLTKRDLKVFIACLLSFSLLTMPFVPVAAAAGRRVDRRAGASNDKSSEAKATVNFANAPQPAPAPEPFVPNISATKAGVIIGDDGDGKADPNPSPAAAEKIEYTVTISNAAGATDASDVTFMDTIDAHTTLVPGSVNTQPIADPDTYTASGNIGISVAAPGVRANDRDPDTGNNSGLTVTEVQGSGASVGVSTDTTATGRGGVKGKVTLSADGSFTYEPPPGFNGDDTFTYKVSDGTLTDTATVKITVSQMVWFIQNNAGGSNIGTFSNPFTSIAAFNTANAASGSAPDPKNGDFVALRTGSGTYNEADGVNLRAQQKLIGNAIQFNTVFTADSNSIAAYGTFAGSPGTAPNITPSAGNGVDLATDNIARGFNVGNSSGFKINGAAVGSPIINTVNLTGTGGALNISGSGAFGSNVTFGTFESTSSAGSNVNLVNVTGTLAVTTTGTGLSGSAAANAGISVSGGSVVFSYPGAVSKSTTGAIIQALNGHTGTLTFSGSVSATGGTGLQFDNADGTYTFSGTTSLNGGDAGIDILNSSGGTFSFNSNTTITSPTGPAFNVGTSPTNPMVTYSGNITQNNNARVINIDGTTGNSITFNTGTITGGASSTGININNASGNVTFSNGMTLGTSGSRMTNQAVTITNGGSGATYALGAVSIFTTGARGIVATDFDGTLNATGTVDTTAAAAGATAAAIDINGPVGLTTLGLSFLKVAANNSTAGIAVQDTNGSFTVTGTGTTDGSGGTISNITNRGASFISATTISLSNMTFTNAGTANGADPTLNNSTCGDLLVGGNTGCNAAIHLQSTTGVTLTNVDISGGNQEGINGNNVTNFSLSNSTVSNVGNQVREDGLRFLNMLGTSSISNTTFSNNSAVQVHVENNTGPVGTSLSMSGLTVSSTGLASPNGSHGFLYFGTGSANLDISVTNSSFDNLFSNSIHTDSNSTGVTEVTITSNTFTNVGASGITMAQDGSGAFRFNISNNGSAASPTFLRGTNTGSSHSINVNQAANAPQSAVMEGQIVNNFIGNASSTTSANTAGNGIRVLSVAPGTLTVLISGNTTRGTGANGIQVQMSEDTNANHRVNATVTNNNVIVDAANSFDGFFIQAGALTGDAGTMCLDLVNNDAASSFGSDFTVRQRFVTTMQLPGYTGANNNNAQVQTFLDNTKTNDPALPAGNDWFITNNVGGAPTGFGFVNTPGPGNPCPQPTLPTSMNMLRKPVPNYAQNQAPQQNNNAVAQTATVTAPQAAVQSSQPSLFARALSAVANFAGAVHSLIEPSAHAASETPSVETPRAEYVAAAAVSENRPVEVKATSQPAANSAPKAVTRTQSRTVSNHARSNRVVARNSTSMTPVVSGETVNVNIGTLRPDDSVVIKFQVTVNNPPNLTQLNPARVSNTGKVSGSNFSDVFTNQVDTNVDLFDTTTSLAAAPNPSNFGDQVTFTATVTENPGQSGIDPTGTVDFIDTSNGNAVVCDDVALMAGQAQCQTSALTAGTHNIRADYSGDGNFEGSQSNVIPQIVIACVTNPIVTSTADAGAGSLREAISQVCNGTTITFNLPDAGPHTITLMTGELQVAKNVTINNNSGERITVTGNNASRVFNINSGKTVSIIGLTISGGNAASGAGVLNDGALTIVNSTLSGNSATGDGGGISTTATGTALTLINTTISGNSAAGSGGGVNVLGGTVTSINSTITNNFADSDSNSTGTGGGISATAGTTTLKNTIVAGNFNEDGVSDAADDIGGTVDAASTFNLIGTGGAGGLMNAVMNNQVGVANAGLGALADNGGLVNTHALLATSPAVETGGNVNLPADTFDLDGDMDMAEALPVDGRGPGFPRNADSSDIDTIQVVDIGAFELHPSIENIADQSTNEDTVKNVSFNIGDDTGSLIATVTATSSNTMLVPNANLDITGSGGSRNLQITPAANESGTTTITVTVTATNGRTATDAFDLTVNAVNDPPSGTDNTVSTAEDTAYTFTAADFGFTDPNDSPANTFLAVKITTLPGLGTLTNNNMTLNAGDFVTVADINGGLLKFTPAPDGFGTPYTSFTFQVQDAGAGMDLDPTPNTMSINVTGVNDAPVNTVPTAQSTDEDVALVFSGGNGNQISVADSDAGANPIKITLTATNGTISLSTTAGLSFITGDGSADATMMFTGTLTAVNTALNGMSFTGTANFSGAASLQIVSDDQGNTGTGGPLTDTDSVNITINALNDPPSGADNTVSTAEDTAYTFTAADFGFTDPNDTPPNTLQAVKITTLPGLGTLTNNNAAVNAGDFISVANINGGLLKFTPAADGNGMPYTTFTFQVQDDGGGTDLDPTPNTITINVTAVNDGPVNTVPDPQSTTEDTPKVFSAANVNQISVADVDAGSNPIKITLTATNGTITLSTTAGLSFITGDGSGDATMMFTGTLTAVNTALNGMSFNPTADFNGAASLQIVSDDQGNSGSGGPLTDTDSVTITVTAENDAPVVTTTAGNLSYTENDPATAIDPALTVADVDSANLVGATIAITSGHVPAQDTLGFVNQNGITGNYNSGSGVLTLMGSSSVANYETALRSVTYANGSDDPTTSRTITFIADDGSSTSAPATRGITITAVNDAPMNTVPNAQGTNQNTPLTFSSGNGNQISVADADAGTNAIQVTLTATNGTLTLSGTSGLAFTVGDGDTDATMTFTGTIANINTALNGMTFTPTAGFSGAATVTITSNDQGNSGSGGPLSDTDVVNIQVSTNVSIQDASLVEPKNNQTANMIFTVTLSAPAPTGGSSVSYTTQDQAPALNHATAGQDYTATSGTVNFAAGEQFKTIEVQILGDNKNNEANETFLVVLSSPVNATIQDGTATGTILITNNAGAILIGELRTSGPGGSGDDFVEIYNNSDSSHTVAATDGSAGYGLFKMGASCGATPVLVGFIPNGTVIPGRGHYLFAGPDYSLGAYGAADQTVADIENDRNVGIFSTSNLAAISTANRLDAVGFGANTGGTCDLLREGATLTPLVGSVLDYSYFRDECGKGGNPSTFGPCPTNGATKDSNDNASDLVFVETTGAVTVAGRRLGAPGPQALGSARFNANIFTLLLDNTKGSTGNPNRVRDNTVSVPNGATGTLSIRRRFVNTTGADVTQLRFRIVDISALGTGAVADLRAIDSTAITVTGIQDSGTCLASTGSPTTPCTVTVHGTTVEQPPNQPMGGALNSSYTTGVITLGTPLAPGASVNLQLVLGVQSSGSFKFFFNVEALP